MPRMSPAASSPRPLWVWSLPSLVLLLSLVWYKRKRNTLRSDPGGTATAKLLPDAAVVDDDKEEEQCGATPALVRSESTYEPDSTVDQDNTEVTPVKEFAPAVEVVTPVKAPTPAVEVVTPVKTPAPVVEVVTPVKAPTPAVEVVTPVKTPAPVVEVVTPVKAPAPAVEVAAVVVTSSALEEHEEVVERKKAAVSFAESVAPQVEKEVVVVETSAEVVSTTDAMKDTKEVAVAPAKEADKVAKDAEALEGKLASLALGTSDASEEQRRGADRDSANHSPVDAMLASPSMSSYSDEHSEGSSDSGKGCSDVASPPSRTPVGSGSLAGDADVDAGTSAYSVYDFLLPQLLVGRLIGRHGSVVHDIKAKTNATICIKRHPETVLQKVCSVEGTPAEIDSALAMIRQRFPLKKYPNVTLEQISLAPAPTTFPLVPDFCQLHLVEGVNNEVMISSLVSPAHMFLQQPYHPSYQFLQRLNHMMNTIYANVDTPNLPDPIEAGNICVAPAVDGWYRAQVVSTNEETQTSEIKFVDYGGYMSVNNSVLRQIRQDFMTLPFQATECYLANIKPSGESGEWSLDALRIVEELTRGQMLLAQVYDYAADGAPVIYLYSSVNSQPWMFDPEVVLINQELVARGMADLDDSVATSATSEAASLVVAAKAVAAAAAGEVAVVVPAEDLAASSTTKSEEKRAVVEPSSSSEVVAN